MTGMPHESSQPRAAFANSYDAPSMRLPQIAVPGRATAVELDATCSRDTPSVWYTSCAARTSRSSPSPTAGAGLATGGRDSDGSSNFPIQRSGLAAAADPARCPDKGGHQ